MDMFAGILMICVYNLFAAKVSVLVGRGDQWLCTSVKRLVGLSPGLLGSAAGRNHG
jgi:hypothetical protein